MRWSRGARKLDGWMSYLDRLVTQPPSAQKSRMTNQGAAVAVAPSDRPWQAARSHTQGQPALARPLPLQPGQRLRAKFSGSGPLRDPSNPQAPARAGAGSGGGAHTGLAGWPSVKPRPWLLIGPRPPLTLIEFPFLSSAQPCHHLRQRSAVELEARPTNTTTASARCMPVRHLGSKGVCEVAKGALSPPGLCPRLRREERLLLIVCLSGTQRGRVWRTSLFRAPDFWLGPQCARRYCSQRGSLFSLWILRLRAAPQELNEPSS